jgi:uncharacterized protein
LTGGISCDLELHPEAGASWEGYAIEEVLKAVRPEATYFWATHNRAELDLLLVKGRRRMGVECKRADAPRLTPSMRIALADLKLDELLVVYPGERSHPLADQVRVVPLAHFVTAKQPVS